MGPHDGFVTSGLVRLHYLDWDGAGMPLLFLHGFGLTAHTWDAVCGALAPDHRCIALDQRGHGDSDWSADGTYPVEDRVVDIRAIVRHLRLSPLVLVGHSMGGAAAISYAVDHPRDLAGLVIIDTGPRLAPRSGSRRIGEFVTTHAVANSFDEFVERALRADPRSDPERVRRTLSHNLRQLPDGRWTWKYDRRRFGTTARIDFAQSQERLRSLLSAVPSPTLVVRGETSDTFLAEDALAMLPLLKRGHLVTVPRAGHMVHGAQPQLLAQAIRSFVHELVTEIKGESA